jgi:NAD(P)-dependent dehydrogenase (short-subunit alcohol dehydrogenase family)
MGRTAIVTGASRGLGLALATSLAASGWDLVVDARGAADLEHARHRITAARTDPTTTVTAVAGDVADPAHVAALAAAARAAGELALVVNNAGTLGPSPLPALADVDPAALVDAVAVNVAAPLRLIQAALPDLRAAGGAIVDVTSDAAVEGYPGWGVYGASKAAFEQLSRVLAAEETGVGVYWVDPGDMATQMHQDAFPGEDISDRPPAASRVPGLLRLIDERPPSGRYRVDDLLAARPDPPPAMPPAASPPETAVGEAPPGAAPSGEASVPVAPVTAGTGAREPRP